MPKANAMTECPLCFGDSLEQTGRFIFCNGCAQRFELLPDGRIVHLPSRLDVQGVAMTDP